LKLGREYRKKHPPPLVRRLAVVDPKQTPLTALQCDLIQKILRPPPSVSQFVSGDRVTLANTGKLDFRQRDDFMEHLIRVITLYTATSKIDEHEVLASLKRARIANRKRDVSGMLLCIGSYFLESLEGETARVDAVSGTMFRDPIRFLSRPIAREFIAEREFAEWTMGFATVDPSEAGLLLGDEQLFDNPTSVQRLDEAGVKTLLSIFGRRRYQADRSGMYRAINSSR